MVDHVRHSGIYNIDPYDVVTVIGCGGIGAITAITLAKMGFMNLRLFDAESIEEENVATQFHPKIRLGQQKVLSVANAIFEHDPAVAVDYYPVQVDMDTDIGANYIVCTVDSIASRKAVWEAAKKSQGWMYYLDARMGAQVFQLYSVYYNEMGWYDQRINEVNEDDIPDLPCTEKATIYTAMGAAAFIGATMRRVYQSEVVPRFQEMNFEIGSYAHSGINKKDSVPSLLQ